MSERKKEARSGAGTPNQAVETGSAMRADTTSHSHDTTGAEREQAGILGRVLPHGKGHAIPGRELVKLLKLKDLRDLTQLVEQERRDGFPICASTDSAAPGYYLAAGPEELEDYLKSLNRRVKNINRTVVHLEDTLSNMTGQQRLGGD